MTGNNSIEELIAQLKDQMSRLGISAHTGLGTDLFHFVSSLTPIVNVDLLVYNREGQFLLIWRDDLHCGKGWHVPGGCIRLHEKAEHRVREVARKELRIHSLTVEPDPIKVFEIEITGNREIANLDERSHFITLVYRCHVSESYTVNNHGLSEHDAGFIKWFNSLPDDFLVIQEKYKQILK